MKNLLAAITFSLSLLAGITSAEAASVTLYNGAGDPNTQGELIYGGPTVLPIINVSGPVNINTTALFPDPNNPDPNRHYAGYSNYTATITSSGVTPGSRVGSAYTLDPTVGYTLNFAVQIAQESAANPNRAGFSVVVIGSNVAPGVQSSIELAFQNGRIFAQNVGFTAGEASTFNPVNAGLVNYSLQVLGTSYTLSANGATILSNQLRDYTSWSGSINPYSTPNFLFFGDNTTSARADFFLGAISANTDGVAAVPYEFSPTVGLLIMGAFATISYLKNRQA
jgi:hypothetical protein